MKLIALIWLTACLTTAAYAQKKKPTHWFSQKLKSADSVLMISHYKTKGNMMVDTNGQIIPFQELILNNKPNYAVVLERKLITAKAIDSLVRILTRPAPRRIYALSGCFSPHHAIFIFKGNQTSYLNLCFDCKREESSKDLFKLPVFDPKRWEDLRAFYIKQGFKYQLK